MAAALGGRQYEGGVTHTVASSAAAAAVPLAAAGDDDEGELSDLSEVDEGEVSGGVAAAWARTSGANAPAALLHTSSAATHHDMDSLPASVQEEDDFPRASDEALWP